MSVSTRIENFSETKILKLDFSESWYNEYTGDGGDYYKEVAVFDDFGNQFELSWARRGAPESQPYSSRSKGVLWDDVVLRPGEVVAIEFCFLGLPVSHSEGVDIRMPESIFQPYGESSVGNISFKLPRSP